MCSAYMLEPGIMWFLSGHSKRIGITKMGSVYVLVPVITWFLSAVLSV